MRFLPAPEPATVAGVRRALQGLAVASEGKTRRTIAVLGDLVTGDLTAQDGELMDLGRYLVRLDLTSLVVVGSTSGQVHAGAVLEGSWGQESRHVDTFEEAVALLRGELTPDDVLLVVGAPAVRTALEGAA